MTGASTTVGVVGAGTMGRGIAQSCANAGCTILLYDIDEDHCKAAIKKIGSDLSALVDKEKISQSEADAILSRIHPTNQLNELRCDFIIEAVVEDLQVKKKLFAELEKYCAVSSLFLSNTSSIEISAIATALKHRQRFAGLHFFNPAPVMKLVEVVKGNETSSDTVEKVKEFASFIGKTAVVAQDSPGFIVNRVARLYYVQALNILEQEAASPEVVDTLMRNAGFRMGPFELMDLIGIDINLSVTRSIYQAFGHERFRPGFIQQQKVDAGLLGRKSGKGFYDYF